MISQINGVYTYPILTIPDERGCVYKMKNPPFTVRDTYATTVRQGSIKAWHVYQTKSLFWTVVSGFVKLVLYDNRPNSDTYKVFDEIYLGNNSNFSVLVPPGVCNGFKGVSLEDSVIVVQADEEYSQISRLPYDSLEYDWSIRNG